MEDMKMNKGSKVRAFSFVLGSSMLLGCFSLAAARPGPPPAQQTAPDNTKANKGDSQKGATTADQQNMNASDREITRKIRAMIMDDKSLSTYAHNVKIISQDGKVTLKGPVRTEKEKVDIESKAGSVAGESNVTSEITIAPSKSQ
jgi:osmotically-inducible protein OsmY